ncbi:hypothetical protein ACWU37_21115 (plasmid) [Photobacterium damselae subsp. damselae]
MKKGWLRDRLVPAKKNSPMWRSFADSVQELLESNVEPTLDRLRSRTSLFTMNVEDLKVVLNELGSFFVIGSGVKDDDLPIVIMQREDEIHQKRTIYPLINTLNREFEGLDVAWEPFYAPVDMVTYPYCSQLIIKEDLENQVIPAEDWFLTSRGVVRVKLSDVLSVFVGGGSTVESDDPLDDFENQLKRVIYPLIPLRIVCDGTLYFIDFDDVDEADEWPEIVEDRVWHDIDIDEADENGTLDESISIPEFDSGYQERDPVPLEFYTMDKHGLDALNLDYNYELLLSIPDFIFTNNIITPNEEYGYQHRDSNGKIKPPADNWKPTGNVDYIDTLYRNSIYYFRFRQIELNKWKDLGIIDIRAESESGEELKLIAVKYSESSKSYGISDRSIEDDNQAKQWYDFLHRNVDQEISVWVSKGTLIPKVTLQPTDAVGHPGELINFTADADEYDSVRWQVRPSNSPTWRDIPGATTTSLSINTEQSIDGYQYRAIFQKDLETITDAVSFYIGDFIVNVESYDGGSYTTYGYTKDRMGSVIQSQRKWPISDSVSTDVYSLDSSKSGSTYWAHAYTKPAQKWDDQDVLNLVYRDVSDDDTFSIALDWNLGGFGDYRSRDSSLYDWMLTKNGKKLVVTVLPWYDFRFKPGELTTDYYAYSKDSSIGEIDPPSDQWQPSGDVGMVMARLLSSGNYALSFRNNNNVKWNDFDFINITAKSETGDTLVVSGIPWDKNTMYQEQDHDYYKDWYDFVKANVGKWIEVGITKGPDFIITPGEYLSGAIYGYWDGITGDISPSSGSWKPTSDVDRFDVQFANENYIMHLRGRTNTRWKGYDSLTIKAVTEDENEITLNTTVFSDSTNLYSASLEDGERLFNVFKDNQGKRIFFYLSEYVSTRDKPKPPPILRK